MDTCEDFRHYLAAYADGELEGKLRERIRLHVERCERCRSECAGLAGVVKLYRESAPPEVSDKDWEKVSAALEECLSSSGAERVVKARRPVPRRVFGWWLVPAAGLAAAVLLVALFIGLPGARTSTPTAQVDRVETGPDYDAMVRLPMNEDDVLVIDVVLSE